MNNTKVWYYARVSSATQSLDRQIKAFREIGADDREIITEKKSGKDFENRESYNTLKNQLLRPGDTLYVMSVDRLGRNKAQIKKELEYFNKNNIRVKILDIPTTLHDFPTEQSWIQDMINNILIEVLGAMAEKERDNTRIRQAQGIECARDKGVVFGRKRIDFPENWETDITQWRAGEITARECMERVGMKANTFYRRVKEWDSVVGN